MRLWRRFDGSSSMGSVQKYLTTHADSITTIGFVGGPAALPQTVVEQAQTVAKLPVGNPGTVKPVTVAPAPTTLGKEVVKPVTGLANLVVRASEMSRDGSYGVQVSFDLGGVSVKDVIVERLRIR